MWDVFGSIQGIFKPKDVAIDNPIFRLHRKWTFAMLMFLSILVCQRQYFGDPIDCLVDKIPSDLMDTYCWIHSTYTIPSLVNATVGVQVPHPGIANHRAMKEGTEIRYHKYYQWVAFFLAFQTLLFYVPGFLWKGWEGGKMAMLADGLKQPTLEEGFKKERVEMLATYFLANLHNHGVYATKFVFCEVLNFVNVVGQIYFTDRFLGYEFTTYGPKVFEFMSSEFGTRHDPMEIVFPKVTKCTFHKYGTSGSIETHDGLCVLPVNILNEKIYVFIWFWLVIVAILSGIGLLYRIMTFYKTPRSMLMAFKCPLNDKKDIELVNHKCQFGDWFLLHRLSKNVDSFVFKDFIYEMASKFDGRHLMQ